MTGDERSVKSNLSDYSYLDDAQLDGWLWEYIRRNPKYREAWKNHKTKSVRDRTDQSNYVIDTTESEAAASFGLLFFRGP